MRPSSSIVNDFTIELVGFPECELAAALLTELRPELDLVTAREFLRSAVAQGYQVLLQRGTAEAVLGMAGFRVFTTSRGRILMLEDLVVGRENRRSGLGNALVEALVGIAIDSGCQRIELDTGISNSNAQVFYSANEFRRTAYHYAREFDRPADIGHSPAPVHPREEIAPERSAD